MLWKYNLTINRKTTGCSLQDVPFVSLWAVKRYVSCLTFCKWRNSLSPVNVVAPEVLRLYSLRWRTSHRTISWNLDTVRLNLMIIVSLCNRTGVSATLLPRCLSNCRAIAKVFTRILRFQNFTTFCGKTRLVFKLRPCRVAQRTGSGNKAYIANKKLPVFV